MTHVTGTLGLHTSAAGRTILQGLDYDTVILFDKPSTFFYGSCSVFCMCMNHLCAALCSKFNFCSPLRAMLEPSLGVRVKALPRLAIDCADIHNVCR